MNQPNPTQQPAATAERTPPAEVMAPPRPFAHSPLRARTTTPRDSAGSRSDFEVYSWFFMRISGVIILFLVLYHLVWWNLVIGVEHLDSQVVIERWRNPLWRFFNIALVSFALLHGLNGARYSIEDYIRKPGAQLATKAVVYTIVLACLVFGIYALVTFDPASFFANR
ncbi:MAG TPA: succinate dehydrogenase hydrophobic membrane anchor subunit [Longimicrobiaceae bacterium]|jgi:succinate dehydrogenase / fumarate reductase membrane anchor subunit|nr:succinate dehydrogenase hydrophobic membrane anchor subunit [Longimicrobiaceae bacterium]